MHACRDVFVTVLVSVGLPSLVQIYATLYNRRGLRHAHSIERVQALPATRALVRL